MNDLVKQFSSALEKRIPLLTQYSPDGWRDFRDGVPPTLRCGLFMNAYDADPDALPGTYGTIQEKAHPNGVRFQTSVASTMAAIEIQKQLFAIVPAECFTGAPEISQKSGRFMVAFELDRAKLAELLNVLDPPPARQFPHGTRPFRFDRPAWRRVSMTVYEGDEFVCQCATEAHAEMLVETMNARRIDAASRYSGGRGGV